VEQWQRYASPVWVTRAGVDEEGMAICRNPSPSNPDGIDQSDTLQARSAREHDDERHLCPLQLEVIRRCVRLWSNPGEVVWSPFMGIGSEGVTAIEMGRRFIGAELKSSYYRQSVANLIAAESQSHKQGDLFAASLK
jgi:DNA modification methylase